MSETIHALKTLPKFFRAAGNIKPFEVRRDDRNFNVGDTLLLGEWSAETGYTGAFKEFRISYILRGEEWGIKSGYCVIGMKQLARSGSPGHGPEF